MTTPSKAFVCDSLGLVRIMGMREVSAKILVGEICGIQGERNAPETKRWGGL